MYEHAVVRLIQEQIGFMGTIDGVVPKIRPMKGYVGTDGTLWLLSLMMNQKVKELALNDQVELCILADSCDMLRLNGILEPVVKDKQTLNVLANEPKTLLCRQQFTPLVDWSGDIYQLRVRAIQYITKEGMTFCQFDEAEEIEDVTGIKLNPGNPFQLRPCCL
mgnify:CR=1 FL=1